MQFSVHGWFDMDKEVKCLQVIQRYPDSEGKVNLYNSCNLTSNIQILINDRTSMTRCVSAQTAKHITAEYEYEYKTRHHFIAMISQQRISSSLN